MYKVCAQWASSFIVQSDSSEDKYFVKFFTNQRAVCTCPAYRFGGDYDNQTCKHIKRIGQFGCFWMGVSDDETSNMLMTGFNRLEDAGIAIFSTTKENVLEDERCPSCEGPMLEVFTL